MASSPHVGYIEQQLIDLAAGTSGFAELGTFYFASQGPEFVSLARGTVATLRADAVRFTKISS